MISGRKRLLGLLILSTSLSLFLVSCDKKGAPQKRLPESREEVALSFAPLIKKIAPAVVNVYGDQRLTSVHQVDSFFSHIFGALHTTHSINHALGSGVLVSKDGLILTSSHVVQGADTVRVTLADRREFAAKVRGFDAKTGLALLQIKDEKDFPYLTIPQESHLEVGDVVLAMGNPFGVGQTVTNGIISALGHTEAGIADLRTFIQTDASVNPGNSGGPLITTDGRFIGINTAIYSKTGSSIGISFATPSVLALPLLKSPQTGGRVVRLELGLKTEPVPVNIVRVLGLSHPYGVLVKHVSPEGPAAKSGLQEGDFMAEVNGHILEDQAMLDYILASTPVGTTIEITVIRQGKKTIFVIDNA